MIFKILCRIGIHWRRERKTYVGCPMVSDVRCLRCGHSWRDYGW